MRNAALTRRSSKSNAAAAPRERCVPHRRPRLEVGGMQLTQLLRTRKFEARIIIVGSCFLFLSFCSNGEGVTKLSGPPLSAATTRFTHRMLLRRSSGASTPVACSRLLPVHPLRVQGPLWRHTLVASVSPANMGGDDGGGGEGKCKVDQATPAAAAAAAPSKAASEEDRSALLDSLASFKGFVVEEVLNVNDMNKVAAVVGR